MKYSIIMLMAALAITQSASAKKQEQPSEITFDAYKPLEVTIEGQPAKLLFSSGLIDRLTINTAFITANGIKPAPIMGNAQFSMWGRKEIKGKNRPLTMVINGVSKSSRSFWFFDVPQPELDGSVGPWAMPFDTIHAKLSPVAEGEQPCTFPFFGDANNGSGTAYKEEAFMTAVTFSIGRDLPYPMASAATGAAIAAQYGGSLAGEEFQVPIIFGLTRPVRLMTLQRPFVIGPFSFTQIMVRTRSGIDSAGSGEAIADAGARQDEDADPAEITVVGTGKKAKRPSFTFDIGDKWLKQCSRISFDKKAKTISMSCRPT